MTLTTPPQGPSDETYVTKPAVTSFPPSEQNDVTTSDLYTSPEPVGKTAEPIHVGLDQEALARLLASQKGHRDVEAPIWINKSKAEKPVWWFYMDDAAAILAHVSPLLEERDETIAAAVTFAVSDRWLELAQGAALTTVDRHMLGSLHRLASAARALLNPSTREGGQ